MYSHISIQTNVKFGTEEQTFGPLPGSKFHVCRGHVSPLRGEKPIFGPVSKNSTGMAALRSDLPVTRHQYASPPEGNAIPAGPVQYPLSDCDKILCRRGIPSVS